MSRYAVLFKESVAKAPEPRWITLLPKLDDDSAPELRVLVSYVPPERRKTIAETTTGKKDWTDALESPSFQLAFLRDALKEKQWDGMCGPNLIRFGEFFMRRPDLVKQMVEIGGLDEFPADASDFDAIFSHVRFDLLLAIVNSSTSLDEWAKAEISKLKNE